MSDMPPTTPSSSPPPGRTVPPLVVAGLDLLVVIVFAAVGMLSHDEHRGLVEVLKIAWPFAAGAAIGWSGYVLYRGRAPASLLAGVWVSFCTVVGGQALRIASGLSTGPTFILVSTVVLAVFLVGWRAVASYVVDRRGGGA